MRSVSSRAHAARSGRRRSAAARRSSAGPVRMPGAVAQEPLAQRHPGRHGEAPRVGQLVLAVLRDRHLVFQRCPLTLGRHRCPGFSLMGGEDLCVGDVDFRKGHGCLAAPQHFEIAEMMALPGRQVRDKILGGPALWRARFGPLILGQRVKERALALVGELDQVEHGGRVGFTIPHDEPPPFPRGKRPPAQDTPCARVRAPIPGHLTPGPSGRTTVRPYRRAHPVTAEALRRGRMGAVPRAEAPSAPLVVWRRRSRW